MRLFLLFVIFFSVSNSVIYNSVMEGFEGFDILGKKNLKPRIEDISKVVEDYKIKSVLEFGSGASTIVWLHHGCFVQTLDESQKYMNYTKTAVQRVFYNADIIFTYSPRIILNRNEVRYKEFEYARTDFDLIYVDGPDSQIPPDGKHTIGMDTKYYLDSSIKLPKVIMVDGRKLTVDFLLQVLKDYDLEELKRHTLFVRN